MKKAIFSLMIVALLILSACASPTSISPTQSSFDDQVATMVAATMQALPTNTPAAPDDLLPHTLYYLGRDDNTGLTQVFRMERDGKTKTQLTFEPDHVIGYDVSLVDGSVAYVINTQLLMINADGSNRRVLVDGGPRENNPWVTNPVFSPDGRILAYGHNGLNLYDLSMDVSSLVLPNLYGDPLPNGLPFPLETYEPVIYSPDGMKLLVALGHWESAPSHGVYHPDTNALVKYAEVEDYIYCCSFHGGPVWSPDSASFYGVASVHDCVYQFGELWRVDANDGSVTRLFNSLCGGTGTVYLPVEPFPASDGQLYYFFGTYQVESGYWEPPVLNMVRSESDGVTDRVVLRDENFVLMNKALWAPDASLVIVSMAPSQYWNWDKAGGVLELYYTDAQKSVVWLASFGYQMKWGP